MLDFLWHLNGSIILTSPSGENEILDRLATALKNDGHPINKRGENFVEFQKSLWRTGSRAEAMSAFDHGRIWTEQASYGLLVKYRLRTFQWLVLSLGSAIFFSLLLRSLLVGAFAFSFLYWGNLALAVDRVAAFLKRATNA